MVRSARFLMPVGQAAELAPMRDRTSAGGRISTGSLLMGGTPPLWFLLNETFQIEFLALAPRSRHSRPHTVSLPRQSDTGPLSTRHDALGSHISCRSWGRPESAARAHPGAS